MLSLPLKGSNLVINFCHSDSQDILSFFDCFTNFIHFYLLRISISSGRLLPKLICDILVECISSSEFVQELIVLISSNVRVGIEALLLKDLSDFLNAEHYSLVYYLGEVSL